LNKRKCFRSISC